MILDAMAIVACQQETHLTDAVAQTLGTLVRAILIMVSDIMTFIFVWGQLTTPNTVDEMYTMFFRVIFESWCRGGRGQCHLEAQTLGKC